MLPHHYFQHAADLKKRFAVDLKNLLEEIQDPVLREKVKNHEPGDEIQDYYPQVEKKATAIDKQPAADPAEGKSPAKNIPEHERNVGNYTGSMKMLEDEFNKVSSPDAAPRSSPDGEPVEPTAPGLAEPQSPGDPAPATTDSPAEQPAAAAETPAETAHVPAEEAQLAAPAESAQA